MLGVLKRLVPERLKLAIRARRSIAGGEVEMPLLPLMCDPNEISIDVGANVGVFTWLMSKASRAVVAVEPHPDLARKLEMGCGPMVQVLGCALSDHAGLATLSIPVLDGSDLPSRATLEGTVNTEFLRRTVTVPLRTLDSLQLDRVGFLKIHVEGHEYPVLLGAKATLETSFPTIFVGAEERHVAGGRERIQAYLSQLGYSGFFFDHGALKPIAEFDVDIHQRPERAKRPGQAYTQDYISNFLFVHPTRAGVLARLRAKLRPAENASRTLASPASA
jgi:FkbM family methyltransferase